MKGTTLNATMDSQRTYTNIHSDTAELCRPCCTLYVQCVHPPPERPPSSCDAGDKHACLHLARHTYSRTARAVRGVLVACAC